MKTQDITIHLIDININIINSWKEEFKNINNVKIIYNDFKDYLDLNIEKLQALVSPGNSYGKMYGGYDLLITEYFGEQLSLNVQNYIKQNFVPYQEVGTSFIIDIPNTNLKLIHTPTMIYPSKILDSKVIYKCMLNSLRCAYLNNITSILIPAFGGATGGVKPIIIAKEMKRAYLDFLKEKSVL